MQELKPECIAVVLCHEVIEDIRTRNKSIIGIFGNIFAPTVPGAYPRITAFVSLTAGRGVVPLEVAWKKDDSDEPLVSTEGEVDFRQADPLSVIDLVFNFQALPFEDYGLHLLEVKSGHEILGLRRIMVSPPQGEQA